MICLLIHFYTITAPIGPPHSLEVNTTTTSIMVDWMAPFDPYSEITSFIVVYQLWSTSLAIETPRPPVTLSNINSTTYTINNLL